MTCCVCVFRHIKHCGHLDFLAQLAPTVQSKVLGKVSQGGTPPPSAPTTANVASAGAGHPPRVVANRDIDLWDIHQKRRETPVLSLGWVELA